MIEDKMKQDLQELVDRVKKIIDEDKTILQDKKFIKFMNKFGYKYDGNDVTLFSVKSKTQ
jgi:hypothetical protein